MKKLILPLMVCLFICAGQVFGSVSMNNHYYFPNNLETATGTVKATGLNSIEIYDEYQKRPERFIYLDQEGQYHQGDYVRIYYNPYSGVVVRIKRTHPDPYQGSAFNVDNRRN